eukprot:gene19486-23034_t
MDKPSFHHDNNKRDMQVKLLATIGVVIGVYVLFTYVIPFARFQFQRIRAKREILQRLENESTVSSISTEDSPPKNSESSSTEGSDSSQEVKGVFPPNFRVSKDKFVSRPTAATVAPSSGGTSSSSTETAPKPSIKSRVSGSASSADFTAPRSGFLPQFSNLPDVPPPVVSPTSLQQQRLAESRRRLIEQQNREYQQSVTQEREKQRLLEEQQRVAAAKEARRQQIIDSVPPEPDA